MKKSGLIYGITLEFILIIVFISSLFYFNQFSPILLGSVIVFLGIPIGQILKIFMNNKKYKISRKIKITYGILFILSICSILIVWLVTNEITKVYLTSVGTIIITLLFLISVYRNYVVHNYGDFK
jgi:hypothetical protein